MATTTMMMMVVVVVVVVIVVVVVVAMFALCWRASSLCGSHHVEIVIVDGEVLHLSASWHIVVISLKLRSLSSTPSLVQYSIQQFSYPQIHVVVSLQSRNVHVPDPMILDSTLQLDPRPALCPFPPTSLAC